MKVHLNSRGIAEARVAIEAWRRDSNQIRPHRSLGYQMPVAFVWGMSGITDLTRSGGNQCRHDEALRFSPFERSSHPGHVKGVAVGRANHTPCFLDWCVAHSERMQEAMRFLPARNRMTFLCSCVSITMEAM